jgi:hypothetical protein
MQPDPIPSSELKDILRRVDPASIIALPLRLHGLCTAATKGHLAKLSIVVPHEIVNDNLLDLHKWQLVIIAIPKPEYDKVLSEVQKDV